MDLVAVVHLPISLSYPTFLGMQPALDLVTQDVRTLDEAGFSGVLIENDNDKPHTLTVNEAQVAWLTRASLAAKAACTCPVGIGVQRIDWKATLAIAAAAELDFVRLDVYVDTVRMMDLLVQVEPTEVLAWRKQIGAEHVKLWVDVHVKHAEMVSTHSLQESIALASKHQADAVLVTGARTGEPPSLDDLRAARGRGVKVLIGSGLTPDNAATLAPLCDGAVVGTSLKRGERISLPLAQRMVAAWRSALQQ